MNFGLNLMCVDINIINKIEQERLDNLINSDIILASIEPEIHLLANNKQWYKVKAKFYGINGDVYLPDYILAKCDSYTLVSKYKERNRVYIEKHKLDENWIIKNTRKIAELRAIEHNDSVNSIAYTKLKSEADKISR